MSSFGSISSIPETAYGFRTKFLLFLDRIERLRKELGKEKSEICALDVGCGNGIQMTFPLGSQGYSVTGIDSHEPSLAFAVEKNTFPAVSFVNGDIAQLSSLMTGRKFHAIILSDILEHLPNPEKLLRDCKNLLADSGIILVSIPNGFGPFEIENFILRKTGILRLGYAARNALRKSSAGPSRSEAERSSALMRPDARRGATFEIPYNHESGHIQFFSKSGFQKLLHDAYLSVTHFETGAFLCGSVTARIIGRFASLTRLNLAFGKKLPAALSSVWYFELKKSTNYE